MKNSFVIIRVWNTKDRKGNVVSARSFFKDRVGHVSLQIIEDYKQTLYVSFWPSQPPTLLSPSKLACMNSVSEDIKDEGEFPDVRIILYDLNTEKIKTKTKELLDASKKTNFPMWCIVGKNCCSTTFSIIKESLGQFGTESNAIQTEITFLTIKKYIEPNDLAAFFEYYSRLENNFYPKLKNTKIDFEKQIKNLLLKHADKGSKNGNIVQYKNMHPEIFHTIRNEVADHQHKANIKALSPFSIWYKNSKVIIPLAATAIAGVAISSALMSTDELPENVSGCLMQ